MRNSKPLQTQAFPSACPHNNHVPINTRWRLACAKLVAAHRRCNIEHSLRSVRTAMFIATGALWHKLHRSGMYWHSLDHGRRLRSKHHSCRSDGAGRAPYGTMTINMAVLTDLIPSPLLSCARSLVQRFGHAQARPVRGDLCQRTGRWARVSLQNPLPLAAPVPP
jgi:hypothetical protein